VIFPENIPAEIVYALKKYNINNSNNNHLIVSRTNFMSLHTVNNISLLINIEKTNNIQHTNKFHEAVNNVLKDS
jgi:hypothetical protein